MFVDLPSIWPRGVANGTSSLSRRLTYAGRRWTIHQADDVIVSAAMSADGRERVAGAVDGVVPMTVEHDDVEAGGFRFTTRSAGALGGAGCFRTQMIRLGQIAAITDLGR